MRIGFLSQRRRVVSLGRDLVTEVVEDRVTGLAAEVAFFGVLSIFPGLLMMAAALGSLDTVIGGEFAARAQGFVTDFLSRMLTEDASAALEAVRGLFEEERSGIFTFSLLGAVLALVRGFAALIRALDVAYDLEEKRSWLNQRGVALGLGLGSVAMTALVLGMLVAGPLLGGGQQIADWLGMGELFALLWDWVRWPVAFGMLVAWAIAVFHIAPNQRTPWRADIPGAIVAAVLWLLVSLAFSLYLRLAGEFNQVLGALGGGLILLVWLYLLSLGLLLGGEMNAILARDRDRDPLRHPA